MSRLASIIQRARRLGKPVPDSHFEAMYAMCDGLERLAAAICIPATNPPTGDSDEAEYVQAQEDKQRDEWLGNTP